VKNSEPLQNENNNIYDIIVVGSGPVGIHTILELTKLDDSLKIAIFGDEPWQPYNRVQLSALLTGDITEDSLYASYDLSQCSNVSTFYNNKIVKIDREATKVVDSFEQEFSYKKLILATGSSPFIPEVFDKKLHNIFTFRDLSDAQKLMSRSVSTRKTVIIGGGLLGLEAARAMQRFNTEVHIVEHNHWLMFRQLNHDAGRYLERHVESLGITLHLSERVKAVSGDSKVTGVTLSNDETIECDTVVVAAGIISNSQLAKESGLNVRRGILVNDHLKTSDENIFAIGECAEHRKKVYGLVAPGLEQASVLAHYLHGERVKYLGSITSSKLKVLDISVFSAGNIGVEDRVWESVFYRDVKSNIYRKLTVINGHLRGALGVGSWPGNHRIQEAVEKERRLWPWQIRKFKTEGKLWNDSTDENVVDWPATATVCQCKGITRGQLDDAMKQGACTVAALKESTGASTVCGSCGPLLTDFVGSSQVEPAKGFKPLIIASIISVISLFVLYFLPSLPYASSVSADFNIDALWRNELFKQISGFSLLGLSVVISFLSFRKRLSHIVKRWDFAYWRLAHVVIGVLTVSVLLLHTGFRWGGNLNFYLMVVFSALLLVGTIASLVIGYEHALPRRLAKHVRSYAVWSHILLLWPLPALLGFHILKTYYY